MKISEVKVDGFGVWTQLALPGLSDELTVFYGPNEAGKTTLMQFVRTVLYGFSPERRRRYLPPLHGGRPGGQLRVDSVHGVLTVQRHIAPSDPIEKLGDVRIQDSKGGQPGSHLLDVLLGGVDEAIFSNVFALGLRELQELGTLNDTEAAQLLYNLTTGLDRVSLVEVMRHLAVSRRRLLCDEDGPSTIVALLVERDRLVHQLDELAAGTDRWAQLLAQRQSLQREVTQLEHDARAVEGEAKMVELALAVYDTWSTRRHLDERLAAWQPAREIAADAPEQLNRTNERLQQMRRQIDDVKRQRKQLREQAAQQPLDRQLWAQAARIEALGEHAHWIASLEDQIQRLQEEATGLENQLLGQSERLGLPAANGHRELPDISNRMMSQLRAPARLVRDAGTRWQNLRDEQQLAAQQATDLAQQLEVTLEGRDLVAGLEDAGRRASQLRRRVQLDERLEQMVRTREELEEQSHELFADQVLPVWVLAGLGALFILGVLLILTGLLGATFLPASSVVGWSLALLGISGTGAAIITKVVMERSAAQRLEACNKQLELLRKQIDETKQERDELDEQIPPGGGTFDNRLAAAEAELQQMEELLPLHNEQQAAEQREQAAATRAAQAAAAVKEARGRWRAALRGVGLPESMTPKHVRQLAASSREAAQLRQQLHARRDELAQRRRELQGLSGRVEQLFIELRREPQAADPRGRLQELTVALAAQQQLVDQRRKLKQQDRQLRRQGRQSAAQVERLLRRRHELLLQAGVADEAEFRQLAARQEEMRQVRRQRDDLASQLKNQLRGRAPEEKIAAELETHDQASLERRWEQLAAGLQDLHAQLASLHQRQGATQQEIKSLTDNRRLALCRLQLGRVDQQLRDAVHRWQVLAVVEQLLNSVREIYETERQPDTLREASHYLEQLSEGHYQRVWTPLGEDCLYVDDDRGYALPLDVLSQGTREAVFLSLRLALVADYARRGITLPIVLDDVLVNFDNRRVKAAVGVFRKFAAQGHQLLLFTCHEHIMKAFKAARVQVQQLPHHAELNGAQPAEDAELDEPAEELDDEPLEDEQYQEEDDELEEAEQQDDDTDDDGEQEDADEDELWEEDDEEDDQLEPAAEVESFDESDEEDGDEEDTDEEDGEWEDPLDEDEVDEDEVDEDDESDEEAVAEADSQESDDESSWEEDESPATEQEDAAKAERNGSSSSTRGRFTWESPEMWWDDKGGDAAA